MGVHVSEWVQSAPDVVEKQHRERLQQQHLEQMAELCAKNENEVGSAMDLFKGLDKNKDGKIQHDGLLKVLNHIDGNHWTEARLNKLLKAANMDDGADINLN